MAKLVWPNALDALRQLLAAQTPTALAAAHDTAMELLAKAASTPLPRAVWKHVILEQKVWL